jgi:enoyl-CoA hydratase/carnithine racemase
MWASSLPSRRFSALQLRQAPPGVLWVTLARPDAFNALSMELLSELHAVFDALQHPPTMLAALPPDFPRVVVLAAAGRAFCGGVDIKVGGCGRSWSCGG